MRFRLIKKRKKHITLGGKRIGVKPLSLEDSLSLFLLVSPYLPLLELYFPQIQTALKDKSGSRPRALSKIFYTFRNEMRDSPGDLIRVMAILCGVDSVWLAQNGAAEEMIEALPVLDEVHNIGRLWKVVRELGVSIRYQQNT